MADDGASEGGVSSSQGLARRGSELHGELFRIALEAAPTGMIMVDREGRIVLVNAQVERIFGYRRQELVGESIDMLVPARFRERHPDVRNRFFAEPVARPMGAGRDLYGIRKDGSEVPVEIGLNPVRTSAGEFVLSSVVDITERKRAEQAMEEQRNDLDRQSREREVLLKEIYHRVKNNLQVISSLLNLQTSNVTDDRARASLEEARNRVLSIALVHEQLYQSSDLARIDFSEYLRSLIDHLAGAFQTNPAVSIEIQTDNVRLPVDLATPCGLIVNELVTNALKHAFPEARAGTIQVAMREAADANLVLSVADTGVGLPHGLDVAKTGSLGLQLVHQLARQLQAKVQVSRGRGTEFSLSFNAGART